LRVVYVPVEVLDVDSVPLELPLELLDWPGGLHVTWVSAAEVGAVTGGAELMAVMVKSGGPAGFELTLIESTNPDVMVATPLMGKGTAPPLGIAKA
jgi:hypothetical protein